MKIGVNITHAEALAAYTAAGHAFPTIPAGKNTIWHHFTTVDGLPAVILNQRGMTPEATDNEQEVNGCLLAIALEAPTPEAGQQALEGWVQDMLEL